MNPTALAKVLSRLVESVPQEIPGTQFMYDEPKFNKGEYKHLAYLKTIKKTDSGRLDLVQDGVAGVGGTYALLDRNKQVVLYCMDYVVNKRGWVTQVKLWALDSDVYKA